jgi:hypothetical protein
VCYLNVGRRHLIGSPPALVASIQKHRPDILFLGDLVASRIGLVTSHIDRIGRLSKPLLETLILNGLSPPILASSQADQLAL